MRDLKIVLIVTIGMVLGFILGFAGPLLICLAYDAITKPSPGSGLMTVGWVFCFVTIPLFTIIGGIWSGTIANRRFPKIE